MMYCIAKNKYPLKYFSCGKLISDEPFLHFRRNLDSFVLLVGSEGSLYIAQDDHSYELKPNQFMLLFPGHEHYGYRQSDPGLHYYWCHFQTYHSQYEFLTAQQMNQYLHVEKNISAESILKNYYILPEFGEILIKNRIDLIFNQLLDLSNRNYYSKSIVTSYILSFLLMELSQNFIDTFTPKIQDISNSNYKIVEIAEWIRVNYNKNLSVKIIADKFGYNPDYLSLVFKKFTGYPLLKYLNKIKISAVKQLLLNSSATIKEIAHDTGFTDEKHFMKLFKKIESLTPTQYRNTFFCKHFNQN